MKTCEAQLPYVGSMTANSSILVTCSPINLHAMERHDMVFGWLDAYSGCVRTNGRHFWFRQGMPTTFSARVVPRWRRSTFGLIPPRCKKCRPLTKTHRWFSCCFLAIDIRVRRGDYRNCVGRSRRLEHLFPGFRGLRVIYIRRKFFNAMLFAQGNVSEVLGYVGNQACTFREHNRGTSFGVAKHNLFRDSQMVQRRSWQRGRWKACWFLSRGYHSCVLGRDSQKQHYLDSFGREQTNKKRPKKDTWVTRRTLIVCADRMELQNCIYFSESGVLSLRVLGLFPSASASLTVKLFLPEMRTVPRAVFMKPFTKRTGRRWWWRNSVQIIIVVAAFFVMMIGTRKWAF